MPRSTSIHSRSGTSRSCRRAHACVYTRGTGRSCGAGCEARGRGGLRRGAVARWEARVRHGSSPPLSPPLAPPSDPPLIPPLTLPLAPSLKVAAFNDRSAASGGRVAEGCSLRGWGGGLSPPGETGSRAARAAPPCRQLHHRRARRALGWLPPS
eukprot:scaffold104648_cov61-Phaeocystis_antarctica.AAC.3